MKRILKYHLDLKLEPQTFGMPAGARVVHVHQQHDRPTIWAECAGDTPDVPRTFIIRATGQEGGGDEVYLGTTHIDWTVWHIHEVHA